MTLKQLVEINQADLTTLNVDAIVNAANTSLLGGGGVDGAIHRAAGPELLAECKQLHGCATGQAKITKGYCLPAKYVIHAVGPVWHGGTHGETELLASCYRVCLQIASEHKLRSIAFPAISCGIYRFPVAQAAKIVKQEIELFSQQTTSVNKIILACFDPDVYATYRETFAD